MDSTPMKPTLLADIVRPKRTRQEKAILKKKNMADAQILKTETPVYKERIQDPQSEKETDLLEIGIILDATNSMQPWIHRAKETLTHIIDAVVKESQDDEGNPLIVRVCFIGFRDHKDDERFSICPFTEDIKQLKDFMNNCIAEGGKDIPEDVVGGLKMCLMQDWTADSAKKVFMIGDAPCHGKQYTGNIDDHYPEGSPEGLTVEALMKEYCKLDIEFSMIKLNDSVDAMVDAMRSCHQEITVKDMSNEAIEKKLADHIMVIPGGTTYKVPGSAKKPKPSIDAEDTEEDVYEDEDDAACGPAGGCESEGEEAEDEGGLGTVVEEAEDEEGEEAKEKDYEEVGCEEAGCEEAGCDEDDEYAEYETLDKYAPAKILADKKVHDKEVVVKLVVDKVFADFAIQKTKIALQNYRANKLKNQQLKAIESKA